MTELVTSGSVGGMASNGCLYPEAGSNRSSHGGNEVAEASGVEGHIW